MLFDFEHVHESENTAPRKRDNWRATAGEIHPATNTKAIPQLSAGASSRGQGRGRQASRILVALFVNSLT
jgi:hypothetical protein